MKINLKNGILFFIIKQWIISKCPLSACNPRFDNINIYSNTEISKAYLYSSCSLLSNTKGPLTLCNIFMQHFHTTCFMQQFHTPKPVSWQIFHVLKTCFIQQKQLFAKYFMKQNCFMKHISEIKCLYFVYVKQM